MENNYNGVIIINKPKGITSRDVVNKLTKVFRTKKIGHTGTLDPLASGVLVCTIGKCTKLGEFLTSTYKEYHVSMELGYETDTLDNTGQILNTSDKIVNDSEIINVINSFLGKYLQEVPKYSAVKINGKKLYEYARNNEDIELPKREVEIKSIDNIIIDKELISFDCIVSKGTYIRSLIRDIGLMLGTYGTMIDLIRTKQSKFDIKDSFSLEDVEKGNYKILTPLEVLDDIYTVECDDELYKKVSNGVVQNMNIDEEYILYKYKGEVVSLYKKDNEKFRTYVMF